MAAKKPKKQAPASRGYHIGDVDTVISVDDVVREAQKIAAAGPSKDDIAKLAGNNPYVVIDDLRAGYGKMEILHTFNLQVARQQSLCLIGPNGAGKSTVLHSIFGFTNIFSGKIEIGDGTSKKDITKLTSSQKLSRAGIAYILQDKSIFPNMTVEENLWMGGYLMEKTAQAKEVAEKIARIWPGCFLAASAVCSRSRAHS
jgi:branched-chain amino acid transport system ATP-binding protein